MLTPQLHWRAKYEGIRWQVRKRRCISCDAQESNLPIHMHRYIPISAPIYLYYIPIYLYIYMVRPPPQKKKKNLPLSSSCSWFLCHTKHASSFEGGVPRTSVGMSVCMCVCLHMAYPFRYRCIWTGLSQGQNCLKIGFHYGTVLINTARVN